MEITGKRHFKGSFGFTLLEVLIALIILTIGLLGTILLETTTIKGNAFSRELQTATILAQDLMERSNTLGYNDALLSNGSHSNIELDLDRNGSAGDAPNPIDESGNSGGIYTRIWQVAQNTPVNNAKTVTVTVSWVEKTIPHSVSMTTIIYGD